MLLGGGLGFVGEDSGEVGAVGVDEEDFEQGDEEAHADAMASHEEGVEDEDVDEDGAEDDEAEGSGASDEDEQASEELEEADVVHPAAGAHDAEELGGRRAGGGHLHGHEGMHEVRTEDDEYEAEQNATDEGEDLHGGNDSWNEMENEPDGGVSIAADWLRGNGNVMLAEMRGCGGIEGDLRERALSR